ncbi:hypothetical protein [Nocardia rhizosphaerihabitans]|nr:hypothetical protein [Nocardia rhizosphaerihabitans]
MPPTFTDEGLPAAIELRRAYPDIGNIFTELDLPPSDTHHRRVLAVLRLRG